MWVFTQDGYVSAVASDKDRDKLVVRARDRESLEMLSEMTGQELVELPGRDYEYRLFVDRGVFNEWLLVQADGVDYTNFKNRIWQTRGDVFHDACSAVWGAMLEVSDKYISKRRTAVRGR